MAEARNDERPLTLEDLAAHLASGSKPEADFRIGSEHEKFPFRLGSHEPIEYEADEAGRGGIKALLEGLMRFGWKGVFEDNDNGHTLIARERGGANVSLEPGGQFQRSGAPLEQVLRTTSARRSASILSRGGPGRRRAGHRLSGPRRHTPLWTRAEVPIMPKGRYAIMRRYMPKVGSMGLDMMFRTCTVQANLDFADEADMVAKFRVSLALQPIATALFANSPFVGGQADRPAEGRAAPTSGPTPTTSTPACCTTVQAFEDGFGASRPMPATPSMCRCISSSATAAISTPRASRSAPSWPGNCRRCRARSPTCTTGPTTCRPSSRKCG